MKKVCLIIIPAILACAFPFFGTAGTINTEAYVEDGRVKKTVTIKEILDLSLIHISEPTRPY